MPTLTILHRPDVPDGYASVLAMIEVATGEYVARHTHPGLEMTYLLEGEAALMVHGRPEQPISAGDWFQISAGVPHSVQIGNAPGRALGHYVVERDKPITTRLEERASDNQ